MSEVFDDPEWLLWIKKRGKLPSGGSYFDLDFSNQETQSLAPKASTIRRGHMTRSVGVMQEWEKLCSLLVLRRTHPIFEAMKAQTPDQEV